jgi:glycosyltransferase involved in cell wall biosynthesis
VDKTHAERKGIAVIGIRGLPANYGGLETCAEELTRRWVAAGHDVRVYCRSNRYGEQPAVLGGVQLVYTPSLNTKSLDTLSHTFWSILHLIFTGSRFRYVHLYNTGNSIFLPLLKLFGKKVILSGDGIEWRREKWGVLAKLVHRVGEKFAVWMADRIVVDNLEVERYYTEKYGVETSLIAYGANDIEVDTAYSAALLKQHNLRPGEYFLFVGRLAPEKGVHNLVTAYEALRTEYPLVIIGDDPAGGDYRDQLFARETKNIRFLGFVYDKDYEQLLANAYMYVSASELEGTSPSLVSAMGAGICSLVNGIDENIATVHGAAYTYKRDDTMALVELWQRLIDTPADVATMGAAGRRCVEQYYRWDAIAEQYLDVFEQVRSGSAKHEPE